MSNLPRSRRKPKAVSFKLVSRDLDILRSLARYRYLRTSQIKRLHFTENKSIQSARRRLKYLYHHGFVGRIESLIQTGHGIAETAYFLDRKGQDILADELDLSALPKKQDQVKPQYLNHALDVSEFQLVLEQSLTLHRSADLHRFVADHELKSQAKKAVGRNRYKLFDQVQHPYDKKTYTVYPDALVILKGIGALAAYKRLYFVEIDRGTEGLRIIRDKIIGYRLYHELGVFKKFGKFSDFRVLIQTTSEKRLHNMHDTITDLMGADRVWITDRAKVTSETLLDMPIWLNNQREPKSLMKSGS